MQSRSRYTKFAIAFLAKLAAALAMVPASFLGNILADGLSTPAEERAIARVERAWYKRLPNPNQIRSQVVLYKYRDNYSSRCRTEAAIFPIGAYPGAGACVELDDSYAGPRQAHLDGVCWDQTREDLVPGSSRENAWNNAGVWASTSCPINRDTQAWGYVAISFQGQSFLMRDEQGRVRDALVQAREDRKYLVGKFKGIAEEAMNRGRW